MLERCNFLTQVQLCRLDAADYMLWACGGGQPLEPLLTGRNSPETEFVPKRF